MPIRIFVQILLLAKMVDLALLLMQVSRLVNVQLTDLEDYVN
jgi:hypothetical protein